MNFTPCAAGTGGEAGPPSRGWRFVAQRGRRVTFRAIPALGLLVAACNIPAAPARPAAAPPPPAQPAVARVTGKTPAAIIALLGTPALDRSEGRTRQLQYRGPVCIVDLFAVAGAAGQTATIGHVEARTPRGDRTDATACLAGFLPH